MVNFACGIFVDLQEDFDTVNHTILWSNYVIKEYMDLQTNGLNHLANCKQFVSIKDSASSTSSIAYVWCATRIFFGPLNVSVIYCINVAIKHSKLHHKSSYH